MLRSNHPILMSVAIRVEFLSGLAVKPNTRKTYKNRQLINNGTMSLHAGHGPVAFTQLMSRTCHDVTPRRLHIYSLFPAGLANVDVFSTPPSSKLPVSYINTRVISFYLNWNVFLLLIGQSKDITAFRSVHLNKLSSVKKYIRPVNEIQTNFH